MSRFGCFPLSCAKIQKHLAVAQNAQKAAAHDDIKEVLMQVTEQKRKTEFSIPIWVALFVGGIILEGAGRFFGWRENPLLIWHEWAPLATVVIALFVCLFGYFRLARSSEDQNPMRKWTGIMLCVLGLTMIGASFVLKYIVPAIFS
jgi:hypothetical protein